MTQANETVGRKQRHGHLDPVTVTAIEQLRKLAQSATDGPRVIALAVELRNKGVPLRVFAKCCGVAVSIIASWQASGARSDTTPARRHIKGSLGAQRSPQMQVIDVVRPERAVGRWPRTKPEEFVDAPSPSGDFITHAHTTLDLRDVNPQYRCLTRHPFPRCLPHKI